MKFDIVVAHTLTLGIGYKNGLPWPKQQKDMKRFYDLTVSSNKNFIDSCVIMGRKTYESLPEKFRPLNHRLNIVITSLSLNNTLENLLFCNSLNSSFELIKSRFSNIKRCYVIGGGQLYKEAILSPNLETIYSTVVNGTYDCDTFFPEIPYWFSLISTEKIDENLSFNVYSKSRFPRHNRSGLEGLDQD